MRKYSWIFTLIALLILLMFANDISAQGTKKITISGTVQEYDWDEDGNVITITINVVKTDVDEDGEQYTYVEEYIVNNDSKSEELFDLIGAKVEVEGSLTYDDSGNNIITIKSYKILIKAEAEVDEVDID